MKTLHQILALATMAAAGAAQAAAFEPKFSDYAFPGTAYTVDATANTFFSANYGITISNAYLYKDTRDTFDGIGIANGTVDNVGLANQAGRIDFIDLTDFVKVDYATLSATTYSAFSSAGALLDTFTSSNAGVQLGTVTLTHGTGAFIAYLTWTNNGGMGGISALSYNYDGKTGGGNTDLPVPEPEAYAMALAGGLMVSLWARKRKQA